MRNAGGAKRLEPLSLGLSGASLAVAEMLDGKPLGLDEGDLALVARLRYELARPSDLGADSPASGECSAEAIGNAGPRLVGFIHYPRSTPRYLKPLLVVRLYDLTPRGRS
jgi:hypothetical protein